jgi:hypothetical protein
MTVAERQFSRGMMVMQADPTLHRADDLPQSITAMVTVDQTDAWLAKLHTRMCKCGRSRDDSANEVAMRQATEGGRLNHGASKQGASNSTQFQSCHSEFMPLIHFMFTQVPGG